MFLLLNSERVNFFRSCVSGQLFEYLQQFSNSLVQKTKALENDLETLVVESKSAEIKLNNCFNEFLMLSNTQFVEHVCILQYTAVRSDHKSVLFHSFLSDLICFVISPFDSSGNFFQSLDCHFMSISFNFFVHCLLQRVYEDDDDVTKAVAATGENAPGATTSTPNPETEILTKFTSAMGASMVALDYFSMATEGGTGETPGGDDDDDDGAAGKTGKVTFTPAKYVRSFQWYHHFACVINLFSTFMMHWFAIYYFSLWL